MNSFNTRIVKKFAVLALAVGAMGFGTARAGADEVGETPAFGVAATYQHRTPADLQQLTAPIALYPDAVLAQVFVASTYPDDVVAAARYLQAGGDPSQLDSNCVWDSSVQGLLQTPDVIYQLAGDIRWMNQLGDTFLNQQNDVFAAVQSLRLQAQLAGNLTTNAQQQVVCTDNVVQIVPADPQIIYVPRYDPRVVYVRRPVEVIEPCVTFDIGVRVGFWLHEDFDWCEHRVYRGNWGSDRPWWRNDRGHDRGDYIHNRPAVYVNNVTNVTNITNVKVNNRTTVWERDSHKSAPRHVDGAIVQHVNQRTTVVNNNTTIVNKPHVNQNRRDGSDRVRNTNTHTAVDTKKTVVENKVNVPAPKPALHSTTNQQTRNTVQPQRVTQSTTHVDQSVKTVTTPPTPRVNQPVKSVTRQPAQHVAQADKTVARPAVSVNRAAPVRPVAMPTRTPAANPGPVVMPKAKPVQSQVSRPANPGPALHSASVSQNASSNKGANPSRANDNGHGSNKRG